MSQESIARRNYIGRSDITSNEISLLVGSNEISLLVGILLSQESITRRNYIGSTWVISQVRNPG